MRTAVLYVNGLGTGKITANERFLERHWQKADVDFVLACVNWYDGKALQDKVRSVESKLYQLLATHERVVLLGSSAGAGLALHVYARNRKENLRVVLAHGRLLDGQIRWPDYRTLTWAAHLTPNNPRPKSQAFYDSVTECEQDVLPSLKPADRQRILVLKPLVDFVVPLKTMGVPGASTHRSWAIGHKLAGLYDLVFARNKIIGFTRSSLLHHKSAYNRF
jgi:hypothetical protein